MHILNLYALMSVKCLLAPSVHQMRRLKMLTKDFLCAQVSGHQERLEGSWRLAMLRETMQTVGRPLTVSFCEPTACQGCTCARYVASAARGRYNDSETDCSGVTGSSGDGFGDLDEAGFSDSDWEDEGMSGLSSGSSHEGATASGAAPAGMQTRWWTTAQTGGLPGQPEP